jgi:UDP-N-acetylmuramate dehydrogenase
MKTPTQNTSLKNYTTFKIGGPAKFFVEVENEKELKEANIWAKENSLPIFILGGGSNLLVSDAGFDGLVIRMNNIQLSFRPKRVRQQAESGVEETLRFSHMESIRDPSTSLGMTSEQILSAEAGANLNNLIDYCLKNNLIGLEGLIGIYGTLSGAVRGNAGAFGSQISDFVKNVFCFDVKKNEMINLTKEQCQFGYRESIFKNNPNLIIWSVDLKLSVGTGLDLSIAKKKIKEIQEKRWASQPAEPSAGCIFKNIKDAEFESFIKNNSKIKLPEKFLENKAIPAAWLIEQSGLKGREVGGAKVSEKHANFIINTDSAIAEDVIALINLIKTSVSDKFNLELEEEIGKIGF